MDQSKNDAKPLDAALLSSVLEGTPVPGMADMQLRRCYDYFSYAARCINPFTPIITDPADHLSFFEEVYLSGVSMLDDEAPALAQHARSIEKAANLSQSIIRLSIVRGVPLNKFNRRGIISRL